MVPFSVRLREVRNARGKKQRETAEQLGVGIRTYQLYEQGKNEPSIAKLIALADFFDVSMDYLLGRADTDPNL